MRGDVLIVCSYRFGLADRIIRLDCASMFANNQRMNWQKITTELVAEVGSQHKLAELAMCSERNLASILAGRSEPSYALGDRLIRMHDQMREMRPRKK